MYIYNERLTLHASCITRHTHTHKGACATLRTRGVSLEINNFYNNVMVKEYVEAFGNERLAAAHVERSIYIARACSVMGERKRWNFSVGVAVLECQQWL